MSKTTMYVTLAIIVIIGLWFMLNNKSNPTLNGSGPVGIETATSDADAASQAGATVVATGSSFSPATVTIKKGQSVTWKVESGAVQIASEPHPTHTGYPGFESSGLTAGKSYTFTFDKVGSWGYHNHLNPSVKGTVVVEE